MRPEVAKTTGEGSSQESAEVPANTRKRARKKANREWLAYIWGWSRWERNRTRVGKLSAMLAWSPLHLPIGITSPPRRQVGQESARRGPVGDGGDHLMESAGLFLEVNWTAIGSQYPEGQA